MGRGRRPMGRGEGADMQSGAMARSRRREGPGAAPGPSHPPGFFPPRLFPNRRPFPPARLLQSGGLAELLHRPGGGTRRAPPAPAGRCETSPGGGCGHSAVAPAGAASPGEGRRLPGEPVNGKRFAALHLLCPTPPFSALPEQKAVRKH